MKTVEYGDFSIKCWSENTRYGFRHLAVLYKNGVEIDKTKACYYNRTWESYEFETVIKSLISNNQELKEVVENMNTINKL